MNTTGFQVRGRWVFKLPDPFGMMPFYPLDPGTLAALLSVSERTAQRICMGSSRLRHGELVYLQVMVFGLIPDQAFLRLKLFTRGGVLYSHLLPDLEISAGSLAELSIQQQQFSGLLGDLAAARARIADLERQLNPPPVAPSNVIRFPVR